MSLTDRTIKNLKATDKELFVSDGGGLYIRVRPSGSKTFIRRSQVGGKSKKLTLGDYPKMGLADARIRCAELDGATPADRTFQQAYDDWIVMIRREYKSPLQVEQRMGKHFLPKFGTRKVEDVTRAELTDQLKSVAKTAPVQANRLLGDMKLLCDYCAESGWVRNAQLIGVTKKVAGGKEATRDRVLTHDEMAVFLCILIHNWNPNTEKPCSFEPATRLALTLALLTGQRSNEVRSITKAQITPRLWTIPKHITKTTVDMQVALPAISYRMIQLALKLLGTVPFKGMEGQTLSHATRYMKFEPSFTPHDLRRTMRTRMADEGVLPHIGEKCLNHKLTGVLAIYDRSEYAAEKRDAWRKWVRYLIRMARIANEKKPPVKGA